MTQPVVRRPSLPLTARDEAELSVLRSSPAHRRALASLAPNGPSADHDVTEGALLHAIFEAGLAAVRESAIEQGYAALAEEYARNTTERRRLARRRKPSWTEDA